VFSYAFVAGVFEVAFAKVVSTVFKGALVNGATFQALNGFVFNGFVFNVLTLLLFQAAKGHAVSLLLFVICLFFFVSFII
jgi:hypothetical protein